MAEGPSSTNGSGGNLPADVTVPAPPRGGGSGAPAGPGADSPRFQPGAMLGARYRLVSALGRGGMGEVYRADDLKLGESVALKFLPVELADDPDRLRRLHDEVRVARKVTHPNVCRVYDIAEIEGQHFISMEYVDGEDLATLLRRIGRFPEDRAVEIAREVCAGLAAAHAQGVVHRDLKPANIMIDGRGHARLTDFGLAAPAESLTDADARSGTPAYMAPEQFAGEAPTVASDVYALGLVLCELFTGKAVVDDESVSVIERGHLSGVARETSSWTGGLDPVVERVIARCLERDPARRPPSALAVAAALPGGDPLAAALAAGETPSPEMVAASGERDAMGVGTVLILAALLAVAFVLATIATEAITVPGRTTGLKEPAVMRDRVAEALDRLGHPQAGMHTYGGYGTQGNYLRAIAAKDASSARWDALRDPSASALIYWYRGSPQPLRGEGGWTSVRRVAPTLPAPNVPGEALVVVDLAGQLVQLHIVPAQEFLSEGETAAAPPAEPDWSVALELAGFDLDTVAEVAPRFRSPFRTDHRRAWTGRRADLPDVEMRVEAGGLDGRVTVLRLYAPWDLERAAFAAREHSAAERAFMVVRDAVGVIGASVMVLLVLSTAVLCVRNVRRRRGDWRGASILGGYVLLCQLAAAVIGRTTSVPRSEDDWLVILAGPVLIGACVFSAYLGLEPVVRRLWPTMLIGSTRLLSGRLRDPLVGRSLLVGTLAGVVTAVIGRGQRLMPTWTGDPPPFPIWAGFDRAHSVRYALDLVLTCLSTPIVMAFAYLVLLALFRVVLRRTWLAAASYLLFVTVLSYPSTDVMPWSILASLLTTGIIVLLFLRYGVLAVAAAMGAKMLATNTSMTSDLGAWYATSMWVSVVAFAALTGYAIYAATDGFRGPARGGDTVIPHPS